MLEVGTLVLVTWRDAARFWSKVNVRRPGVCWPWRGATQSGGYGSFNPDGRSTTAHRFAYVLAHNCAIPDDVVVRHKCDNPPCVNPDHLELGTKADNARDMAERGRSFSAWGELSGKAKLTQDQVDDIRFLYACGGWTHRSLGAEFGVRHSTIGVILRGKAWRAA